MRNFRDTPPAQRLHEDRNLGFSKRSTPKQLRRAITQLEIILKVRLNRTVRHPTGYSLQNFSHQQKQPDSDERVRRVGSKRTETDPRKKMKVEQRDSCR